MQLIEDEKRISSMGALLKKKYLESAMTLSKNEKKVRCLRFVSIRSCPDLWG